MNLEKDKIHQPKIFGDYTNSLGQFSSICVYCNGPISPTIRIQSIKIQYALI